MVGKAGLATEVSLDRCLRVEKQNWKKNYIFFYIPKTFFQLFLIIFTCLQTTITLIWIKHFGFFFQFLNSVKQPLKMFFQFYEKFWTCSKNLGV